MVKLVDFHMILIYTIEVLHQTCQYAWASFSAYLYDIAVACMDALIININDRQIFSGYDSSPSTLKLCNATQRHSKL